VLENSPNDDLITGILDRFSPNQIDPATIQLDIEGMLDPRSEEFKQAVRLTPATLASYRTKGRWIAAEHLMMVSSILATDISQGGARIIVEVPPRHGKSELISVHTPIWFEEKFPWAHTILATYAADFSAGFGRRVRDAFLTNEDDFLKTRIRDDAQGVSHFITTEGGSMTSVGIGGPITGRGAHLLIVDDYIKNWAEASSPTVLESIFNWFITTAYTRLEPGGSVVILATRWVIDDLIGRLKAADKDHMWTVIRMPAIAEAGDLLNRKPGEALWPERYPLEVLRKIEGLLGDYMWSALYQQNPKKIGDTKADVEQIRIWENLPTHQSLWRKIRSWDLAATDTKKADWSVGSLVGTDGRPGSSTATTCVMDMVRRQLTPAPLETLIRETAEADGTDVPIVLEQEPGSSGKIAAQHIATNVLRGFKVKINPSGGNNKWIRNQPYIAAVSHGRIAFIRASWNETAKKELKDFPSSTQHDDTVDSVGQGFNELHQTKILTPTWGRDRDESPQVIRGTGRRLVKGVVFGRSY
jgi:predicted phage terminase large subunit-like protein